jgi:large subunit ribosomal protein L29
MKVSEFRDQTAEELVAIHLDLKKKKFEVQDSVRTDSKQGAHEGRQVRRDIARLLTVLNEKKRVGN